MCYNHEIGPGQSECTPEESIVSRVAGNGRTQGTQNPLLGGKEPGNSFREGRNPRYNCVSGLGGGRVHNIHKHERSGVLKLSDTQSRCELAGTSPRANIFIAARGRPRLSTASGGKFKSADVGGLKSRGSGPEQKGEIGVDYNGIDFQDSAPVLTKHWSTLPRVGPRTLREFSFPACLTEKTRGGTGPRLPAQAGTPTRPRPLRGSRKIRRLEIPEDWKLPEGAGQQTAFQGRVYFGTEVTEHKRATGCPPFIHGVKRGCLTKSWPNGSTPLEKLQRGGQSLTA